MMGGKVRKEQGLSLFSLCPGGFFVIVVCDNGMNCIIHFRRKSYGSFRACKYESRIPVDLLCAKACDLLYLKFLKKCLIHFTDHRDPAASGLCLRSIDMVIVSRIVNPAVDQIVVNVDDPVFEVQVLPSEAEALTYPHSGPDQNRDDRLKSLILMVCVEVIHKSLLLGNREGSAFALYPHMAPLDLSENPCRRVDTDGSVADCHLECRVKLGMNIIDYRR